MTPLPPDVTEVRSVRSRKILSLAVATALVVVAGATAIHASIDQHRSRPLNRQNVGHIIGTRDTQSTTWVQVGGWSFSDGMVIQARGAIAATLSVTISDAPVDFRIVIEGRQHGFASRVMKPTGAEAKRYVTLVVREDRDRVGRQPRESPRTCPCRGIRA